MPFDIDREARYVASKLDHQQTNEAVCRLQQDAQTIDPRGYAALLQTINRYDQKGVGDDLVIINNRDGSQEALIKPAPIDMGLASAPPPPREYYPQQQAYPDQGYNQPQRNDGCTALSAVAGGAVGNVFAPNGRRTAGTVIGALVGGAIGNDKCNR